MQIHRRVFLFFLILFILFFLKNNLFATSISNAIPTAISVPLEILNINGSTRLGVEIQLAGGSPMKVLLDTGSVGLRVFPDKLGKEGLVKTQQKLYEHYSGGDSYRGIKAFAPMEIGGVTTGPIGFQIIQKSTCKNRAIVNCRGLVGDDFDGIMGIDLAGLRKNIKNDKNRDGIISPLVQLPGNLKTGFIIEIHRIGLLQENKAVLILGLTPENKAGFAMQDLTPLGHYLDGNTGWNDKSLVSHIKIQGVSMDAPTTFDTGEPSAVLTVLDLGLFNLLKNHHLPPNVWVNINLPTGQNWSFLTQNKDRNLSFKIYEGGADRLNTGVGFFMHHAVLYDMSKGRLGVKL